MEDFKKLRQERQKSFNIDTSRLIPFEFETGKRDVYDNCNLSIFLDDYCNADCKFCVAQLRYENQGMIYKKKKIDDDEEYYRRLDEILTKIEPLNVSVSLTGGEPTASPKLIKVLELLEKHHIRKRTITTNGSMLLNEINGKKIIDYLIDYHMDHLNISKTHYDEEINKKIMHYSKGYCSNEDLEKIIPYALSKGLRPRLSCLLLKDGIHTIDDIANYISFYEKYGIDNVIFRELMDYDEKTMSNIEKMLYCKCNKIRLNDVWPKLEKDKRFKKYKNLLGYYYYVEMYYYNDVVVCSESADLKVQSKEKGEHENIVYEMVIHPNGNLCGSWVDNEDILMEYKK